MDRSEPQTLPAVLHARRADDSVFLVEVGGRTETFASLEQLVSTWAGVLRQLGVTEGARVLVMMDNGIDAAVTWLAAARLRAIEVPINTAWRGAMLKHAVDNSGARVLIADEAYVETVADALAEGPLPFEHIVQFGGAPVCEVGGSAVHDAATLARSLADSDRVTDVNIRANDTACIIYTSGTTGPSKGVVVPWGQVLASADGCMPMDDLGPDDVWYSPFAMFHMGGKIPVASAGHLGCRLVLRPSYSTGAYWQDIRDHGCTTTMMIGTTPAFLWTQPRTPKDSENPLRNVLMAPVPDWSDEFCDRFGIRVRTVFNMTELSVPIASEWNPTRPGTCGRVRQGYEVRLVDELDNEVAAGEPGEIVVRSDRPWRLMAGYWNMPEATVAAWQNQWLHTGDLARCDSDGYFYFVDRRKDAIRRRGENISSMEVEQSVLRVPGVRQCAVVGVPSKFGEEEVMAFIVAPNLGPNDLHDIHERLGRALPRFMVPRYYALLSELPRTPTEKVRKAELKEAWRDQVTWDANETDVVTGTR